MTVRDGDHLNAQRTITARTGPNQWLERFTLMRSARTRQTGWAGLCSHLANHAHLSGYATWLQLTEP